MPSSLRQQAEAVSLDMGFSSLQEVVRVLLNKLASKRLVISVEDNLVPLSAKNEARYLEMDRDFKKGRNIKTAKDVDDLMKQLNAD